MNAYTAPKLMAIATPSFSRSFIVSPMRIFHGARARTKSKMAEYPDVRVSILTMKSKSSRLETHKLQTAGTLII